METPPTTIVHAVMLPVGSDHSLPVGLWGETVRVGDGVPPGPSPKKERGRLRRHPRASPAARLLQSLETLALETGEPLPSGGAEEPLLPTFLPTALGRPLGSWEPVPETAGPVTLQPWGVSAIGWPFHRAVPFLAALPPEPESASVKLGVSVRYLSDVARFSLSLVSRQRFLPAMESVDGTAQARWRAVLTTDEDLAEEQRLLNSFPFSLEAALPPREVAAPRERGVALVNSAVDGLVRGWLTETGGLPPARALPEDRWMKALGTEDGSFSAPSAAVQEIANALSTWSAPLTSPAGQGSRVCFRLDPPGREEDTQARAMFEVPDGKWWLRIFLQDRSDPSLLIPARVLFDSPDGFVERAGRRIVSHQEQLLADLARASRLYPPLGRILNSPRPEACSLTIAEAYTFLREAGPVLSEGGYGVLAPPWWTRPKPLGARIKVFPEIEGSSLFGLNSLVRFEFEVAMGGTPLSREELESLAALKVPLVRLRGQWVEVRHDDLQMALRALQERRNRGSMPLGEALRAISGGSVEGLEVMEFTATGWIDQLLRGLSGDEKIEEVQVPAGFSGELRPYQSRGVGWLAFLRRFGLGACLADDMGLGKTVQALAHLLRVRSTEPEALPSLLVCPTSVITNWVREAERFTPGLKLVVHHGLDRARRARKDWPAPAELVVTSYSVFWRDQKLLTGREWDTVLLDEAQNIKNPDSRAAQTARKVKARHRIALTGTPIENRLTELWSIMEFLNGGFLGSLDAFQHGFAYPIEREGDGLRQQALRNLVRPFVLRRVKTDPKIAPDLPEKAELKVLCPLTKEQATLYQATVTNMLADIETAEGMQRRGLVLAALTKLKQICNHPALFLHDRSAVEGRSGKLTRLEEMLGEALEEKDRCLIFTQYTEMGEMLRRRLVEVFGIDVPFLHGSLGRKERDRLVQSFQSDGGPPIFLLSLRAGGTGLNLTAANRVFHFDRWWNPAVENQATDRAFRIGQHRNVMMHKFVVAGTLEERIDLLMERKRGLAEQMFSAGEGILTEMSTAQLRDLFTLRTEAVPREYEAPLPRGRGG